MFAMDGTPNKAKLGANSILGVSLAVSKAGMYLKDIFHYSLRPLSVSLSRCLSSSSTVLKCGGFLSAVSPSDRY